MESVLLLPRPMHRPRIIEQDIIRLVCMCGSLSRMDLSRRLNLSAPTVAKATKWLLGARMLEEVEVPDGGIGRPAKRLRLARESAQVLGIVIAPIHCSVVSTGLDGCLRPERTRRVRTPDSYDALIGELAAAAQGLVAREGPVTLGAGVCIPGLIDYRTQCSVLAANVPMIEGHSPAFDLGRRLGVECATLHSKHALCMSEIYFGDGRDLDDMIILDFSTGMVMGMVSHGQLVRGKNGFAGEVGHMTIEPGGLLCGCGNHGCWQTVASDVALAARVTERLGRSVDIDEVVSLSRSGELSLDLEIRDLVRYLSIGMANVINIFNPSTLMLHGRIFDLRDDFLSVLLEETGRRALKPTFAECRIVRARGNKSQGAVAAALHHIIESLAPSRVVDPLNLQVD
jgi:predicted NBD/HSP70 family sugar kinase